MTPLQIGLIVAGVVLVIGVIVYNWLVERRVRRQIDTAFGRLPRRGSADEASAGTKRVEPTLASGDGAAALPENPAGDRAGGQFDEAYEPPLEIQARIASDI